MWRYDLQTTEDEKNPVSILLGEGYVGVTRCATGLRCFARRDKRFAVCAATCPSVDWVC